MEVECIKISPWKKVKGEAYMIRTVGDEIEVRKCRLWERIKFGRLNVRLRCRLGWHKWGEWILPSQGSLIARRCIDCDCIQYLNKKSG